jgi:peptide-methionine (R)-S-oxide reductase
MFADEHAQNLRSETAQRRGRVIRGDGHRRFFSLPFTGKYVDNHADGTYTCAGCGAELFDADTKFESGSGWPSFTEPKVAEAIELKRDGSHGMIRNEVVCRACGGHLGHVFEDGPRDKGGLRYCMNSCAMEFQPATSA